MVLVLTLLLLAFAGWAAPQATCWEEDGIRWCAALDGAQLRLGRVTAAGIEDAGPVPAEGITTIAASTGLLGARGKSLLRLDLPAKRWAEIGTLPAPILQLLPGEGGAMVLTGTAEQPVPDQSAVWWVQWTPVFAVTRVEAIGDNDHPWQLWWATVDGEQRLAAATHRATYYARFPHHCMFLYAWKDGKATPCWLGSRLSRPYREAAHADLRADGRTRLIALEETRDGGLGLSVYTPAQFGYTSEWRTESLPGLERIAARGTIVICTGNDDAGNARTWILQVKADGYELVPLPETPPSLNAVTALDATSIAGWWEGAWHIFTAP